MKYNLTLTKSEICDLFSDLVYPAENGHCSEISKDERMLLDKIKEQVRQQELLNNSSKKIKFPRY